MKKLLVTAVLVAASVVGFSAPAQADHLTGAQRAYICKAGDPYGNGFIIRATEITRTDIHCVIAYQANVCWAYEMRWFGGWKRDDSSWHRDYVECYV